MSWPLQESLFSSRIRQPFHDWNFFAWWLFQQDVVREVVLVAVALTKVGVSWPSRVACRLLLHPLSLVFHLRCVYTTSSTGIFPALPAYYTENHYHSERTPQRQFAGVSAHCNYLCLQYSTPITCTGGYPLLIHCHSIYWINSFFH